MLYIFLAFVVIVLTGVVVFVNYHPAFGGRPEGQRLARMQQAPNYKEEHFTNLSPTKTTFDWKEYAEMFQQFIKGNPNIRPTKPLPYRRWSRDELQALDSSATTAIWYGHSAFYLQMNGRHILIDPMFGNYPAPVPMFVGKRFNDTLPIAIADLPVIDVVVISHDHYDHLDYGSIVSLRDKVRRFLVPLGVGAHLEAWGVDANKITELYWYEQVSTDGITFVCTPARHFSGRGITDKMRTLWCSWVIKGNHNLFFSGDSGYFDEFKNIGNTYGPFDACMMECGQYNELWKDIHMFPEETARAHCDLKGRMLIPIHWGAFSLGMHDWDEPVNRLAAACADSAIQLVTPIIGEPIHIGKDTLYPQWWRNKL